MTAFLIVDDLRATVTRAVLPATFGPAGGRALSASAPPAPPVLTARWLVAPDGRLTCRWENE